MFLAAIHQHCLIKLSGKCKEKETAFQTFILQKKYNELGNLLNLYRPPSKFHSQLSSL